MDNLLALAGGTELVGDYRLKRILGVGGFGITYLARDLALNRSVAIKEYFPSDYAAREGTAIVRFRSQSSKKEYHDGLERFIEEAQALARFDHPNIVRVFRYFRANNTAYMVLQFEGGRSLKGWLDDLGRAPVQSELDALLMPILDALELLHDNDFLHRDIAPDNIIVRSDGSPVLIDFGSARGEMAALSRTVSAIVKPGYSPFEQYASRGSRQGPWTDIYSLAATLYHAVTGERPLDAPSRMSGASIRPAAEAPGDFRMGFLKALDAGLAIRADERPQTVAEWRKALFSLDGEVGRSVPAASLEGAADDDAAGAAAGSAKTDTGPSAAGLTPLGGRAVARDHSEPRIERATKGEASGPEAPAASDKGNAASNNDGPAEDQVAAAAGPRPKGATRKIDEDATPDLVWRRRAARRAESARRAADRQSSGTTGLVGAQPLDTALIGRGPAAGSAQRAGGASLLAKLSDQIRSGVRSISGRQAAPVDPADTEAKADTVFTPKRLAELGLERPGWLERFGFRKPRPLTPEEALDVLAERRAAAATPQAGEAPRRDQATPALPAVLKPDHRSPKAAEAPAAKAPIKAPKKKQTPPARPAKEVDRQADWRRMADAAQRSTGVGGTRTGSRISVMGGAIRLVAIVAIVWLIVDFSERGQDRATATAPRLPTTASSFPPDVAQFDLVGAPLRRLHRNEIVAIASAADARRRDTIVSVDAGQQLAIWSLDNPDAARKRTIVGSAITSVAMDDDRIAVGRQNGSVQLWNAVTAEEEREFPLHDGAVKALVFGPRGRVVSGGADGALQVTEPGRRGPRRLQREVGAHEGGVTALAITRDGRRLVSGGRDARVHVWSLSRSGRYSRRSGQTIHADNAAVTAVAVSDDGRLVAIGAADGDLRVIEPQVTADRGRYSGPRNAVTALHFADDNRYLLSGNEDGSLRLWDVGTKAVVTDFEGHSQAITGIILLDGGRKFASTSKDGMIRIWNLEPRGPS